MNMINWLSFLNHKYEMSLKILQITARVAAILDLCKLTIVPGLGFLRTCYVTFGVCIYSLAGLLIAIRLWVCLQVSVMSS